MWVLAHTVVHYLNLPAPIAELAFSDRLSAAVATAFIQSPHSFVVGGVTLMLAIQLFSLGILALQNKRYFEELFHLGTTIYTHRQGTGAYEGDTNGRGLRKSKSSRMATPRT